MLIWFLTAALMLADLSPAAQARLAPFNSAVAEARAGLAALNGEAPVTARLEALRALDQRPMMTGVDLSGLSEPEQREARAVIDAEINRLNAENVEALLAMIPAEGWFSSKVYGQEAATGAFLIIQHSNMDLQKRFLPVIEHMAGRGDALKSEYALMYDRIAVAEGRLQRYGTQMQCVDGFMRPFPTEDPDQLEARRAPMGFRWPDYAGSSPTSGPAARTEGWSPLPLEHLGDRHAEDGGDAEGGLKAGRVFALFHGDDSLAGHADPRRQIGLGHLAGVKAKLADTVPDRRGALAHRPRLSRKTSEPRRTISAPIKAKAMPIPALTIRFGTQT